MTGGVVALQSGSNSQDSTTVTAGTLRLSAGNAAGTGTVALAAGSTLDITGASLIDNLVTLAGAAHITSSSGGGTLSAAQALQLAPGPATLQLSSAGDGAPLQVARNLVGDGTLQQAVAVTGGLVTLAGSSNSHDATTVSGGTLAVGADGALGGGSLTLSGGSFSPTASFDSTRAVVLGGGSITLATGVQLGLGGLVSGGTLDLAGDGTLVLARAAGANSYTGGTNVGGGTLRLSSSGAAGTGTIALGANTLDITGAAVLANRVTVADGAQITSSSGSGTLASAQGLTLAPGGSTLRLAGSAGGALVVGSNLVGDASAGQVVEVTGGVVALAGTNTHDATTVSGGTLRLGASAAAGSGSITLNGNQLDITGGAVIANALTVADGARITSSSGGGTLSAAVPLALASGAGTLRLSSADAAAPLVVARNLVGDASAQQAVEVTAGLVTLSGSNSQDATTVSGGTLRLAASGAAGSGAISVGANTLDIVAGAVIARDVGLAGGSLTNSSGGARLDGALTLDGAGSVASTGSGLTLAGVVGDLAPGTLTVTAGRVTLRNDNTYRGGTTVAGGTLVIDGSVAGADAGSGTIALGGNVLDIVNGASVANRVTVADGATIRSSSGGGTLSNAQTLNLAAGASTLNLAGGATQPLVVARSLLDHASGLQAVALTGGLVTLAGSNTHDGGTTVGGGATLALAAAGALGSGALTLDDGRLRAAASLDITRALVLGAGGATVEVDDGQTLGLGGALSGAALAKAGGGTLVLSAHNTYAGGTTVAGGTLALSGTLADAGGGSIQLGNRVLDLRDGAAPANAVTVDGGSITNSSGSGRLGGAMTLAGDATLSSTGSGLTLAGAVGESGGVRAVTIAGGRVTLTADNAWRGGTTVTGGTLAVNAAQVPGADAGSGAIALGNGTLDLQGGAVLANAVTVDGGILTSSAGSGRLNGTLTLLGDARLSSSGGSSGLTLAGAIGSANVARNLATSGSVVLLADNSHLGTTTVQGGTLALSGAGADAGASTVLLNAGTLDLRGGATPANAVVASGGAITNSSGSGRLGGSLTLATASTTVSSTGDGLTLAGAVGESGGARALQLTTGRLVLTRDNSHSGGTTLAGGTLVIDGATADAGSGTIALGGNVLDIVNGASVGNALTVADGAHIRSSQGGGTLAARPGDATALTLAAGNSTLTLSATDAGALVIARPLLNHASGLQQVQVQGGVVELAATGSHDGGTTVSAGTLRLAATGAAGSGTIALGGNRLDIVDGASVANALTAADGATIGNSRGAGTLAFNATPVALAADTTLALFSSGAGLVVDRAISAAPADAASARLLVSRSGNGSGVTLQRANSHGGGTTVDAGGRLAIGSAAALGSGALTLDGGTLASTAAFDTTRPLVLGAGGGTVDTTGGDIGLAGTVSGTTLTKAGTGTLVLSADNSHTGGTVVDRGTLAISAATVAGADAGSGPITVGSQTLDLRHGAVLAADLTLDGGTLANSAGSGRFDGRLSVQGVSTLSSTGSGLLVNGVIGEAAAGTGLVTQGPVTLTATSTYNGTITIGSGALTLSGAAARAGSGDIVVGANRLDIVDGASVANRVRIGAGGSLANTRGSGTVAADGAVQLSGNARLQVSGDGLTLAAVVSEAAGAPASAVTIGGGGRVTLLAANSQRGDTTVEAGTLVLRGGAAATGSGRLLLGANTLDLADGASLPNRLLVADGATLRNSSGAGTLAAAGGPIALAGGATLHLDSTGTGLLVDRAVDDAGSRASLQVSGAAGQVRLAQPGTLGGTVRVDGGATLVVGAAGALGAASLQLDTAQLQTGTALSNAITLGNGGATVDTGAASVSFSGVIGGSGGLVKQGSGTLVLQADNSYSGTTTVAGGVLAISGSGADAGSGAIAVGSQVLDLRNGASPAQPVVLGAGGVLRNSAGSGSIAANGSLRLDGDARLEVTATGTGLGVLGAVSETTRAALTVATTATAAVTLAAANGASGGTTVAAGTLRIDTPQGSAGLGTISLGAGTLDLSNGAVVPNPVSVAGGALRNSAGTGTLAGPLVMAGGATLGSSGSGLSLTGEVSGSGVLVSDAGNVTLGHAGNPFDGGLQVGGGSLRLAGGDAVPDTASVTLAGSGRLLLAGNETLGALAGSAATGVDLGSFTLSVGGNGVASRFDGVIAGTGSLRKTGAASLTLAGANSYTGTTTVDQGTLVLAGADERLADASRLVVQGGSVDLGTRRETVAAVLLDGGSITNGSLLSASNFDLRAGTAAAALGGTTPAVGVDKTGAGLVTLAGRNSYTGTTTLAAGTLALDGGGRLAAGSRLVVSAGTLDLGGGAEAVAAVRLDGGSIVNGSLASVSNFDMRAGTVAAALGGSSDAVGLDKTGADTLTLSGANTYRGDTTLRAGRLVLAGGADVLHDAGTLRVAGGTLDTAGHAETVGLLSVQAGTVTGAGGVLRSVQAFDLQAGTVDAVLGGSAGAVKQGPGTVTLAAANQYTGLTRVDAGELVLAGAQRLAAAGTLQVAGGATLTLGGEQALAGLVMAGSLGGTGTLMVPTVELDGGQLGVPLVVTSLGSSGSSSIGADTRAGTLTVRSGTLQLAAADLLADGVQLAVERGATLALAGNETIGTLQLRGTLSGPGTLSAATYALDGGRVHSTLGAGALTSTGTSLLDAAAAVSSVDVLGGVLTTGAGGQLTALPAVTVAGGARWALQVDQRIGSLAGAGQVDLAANTLRTGVLGDSRFDGVLGGDGGLVKQGGSRFTLGGANTYTGDTVVEAGTLALAGADRLADATRVQVASGANLALDATDTVAELQLAGTLAGNGQLTAARYLLQSGRSEAALGAGALTSQGDSTVAGAARVDSIDVADGRLVLAAPAALTSAPATLLAAGSTLLLQGDATLGSLAGAGELVLDRFTLRTGGGGSSRFDGVLSGDGALEKLGDTRFTLGASQRHTGGTTVLTGTLALDGADRLADAGAVTVAPGAVLALAGDDRVASLALQGTLAGTGTLSAATYALDGGTVLADLGAGTLSARGSSTLAGRSAAGTVDVQAGRLTLAGANRLTDAATLTVAAGATLTLNGPARATHLVLAGTLDGSGTFSAAQTSLQAGTVLADLGGGALHSRGESRLAGQAAVDSLAVQDGRLTLASAGRLSAAPATEVAAGARLVLGGDETLGRLSGAGDVAIGAFTLRTGGGGSSSFAGVIDGDGGLVKLGADTTFGLTGRNTYRGSTWVAAGTLEVGDGASAGAIDASRDIRVDGTLQFNHADAVLLAQPVAGSGGITQAGSGTLTFAGSNKTYTGPTDVRRGTLASRGDEALSDASTVQVAAGAALQLGGAETIAALQADGPVQLAGRLSASGALVFNGAATVPGGGPLLLQAAAVDARAAGNDWGSRLSLDVAGAVQLSSGAAGAGLRPLTLGEVQVGGGGRIEAASILLDGATRLRGGTLVLDLQGGEVFVEPGGELLGRLSPANRQIAFTGDLLQQTAATAGTSDAALALQVDAGARLDVQASRGGSVALLNPANRIDGGLSVVLGEAGRAWVPNLVRPAGGTAGTEYSLQNRVRLTAGPLRIAGAGIQADVVLLQADTLATDDGAAIVAKLPFDNQAGTASSLPGLTLVLRDPAAFADSGGETTSAFGSGAVPLRIDVGSTSFGNRTELPINGGYVSLQPTVRLGGMGRTTVFLQGPATATGYSFFYDGARRQGTIPVFYNGESAVPPQVSGSIASTLSVSEGARKERFDEAVRTENVALRLRAGVIAEVGPGTPATVNTMPMEGLRPPSCAPAPGTLSCGP
ncbi:MAG TPA: autotransporter-associated beta strand repeat-containing protein [Aquabacterium sp.]|nr:autotransporter-associated beta strand repeat-containing protein [Aquabacterium sp.]